MFTHAVVGAAAAAAYTKTRTPLRIWGLSLVCAIIPDADVLAFKFGIPYAHFLGHRGFFHSLFLACVFGFTLVSLFFGPRRLMSKQGVFLGLYFSAITCSHGILDAFTNGGLGIALLSPFDTERYFFWTTPIAVAPINPARFFTARGISVMQNELVWVWLPVLSALLAIKFVSHLAKFFKVFHRDGQGQVEDSPRRSH